jgi:hypothetical protein
MSGTISGQSTVGITLAVNPTTITGTINAATGNAVYGAASIDWTLINQGDVSAFSSASAIGVDLAGSGTIFNEGGLIQGGTDGVSFGAVAGYVLNSGTIIGSSYAILGASTLAVDPGAVFDGAVSGRYFGNSALLLEGLSGQGSIGGFGTSFNGFSRIIFDHGAAWSVSGLGAALGYENAATYHNASNPPPAIEGFASGDKLTLTDVAANAATFGGSYLTLTQAGSIVETLAFTGSFAAQAFSVSTDGTGIDITTSQTAATNSIVTGTSPLGILLTAPNYATQVTIAGTIDPSIKTGRYRYQPDRPTFAIDGVSNTIINQGIIGFTPGKTSYYSAYDGILLGSGAITNITGGTIVGYGYAIHAGNLSFNNAGLLFTQRNQAVRAAGLSVINNQKGAIFGTDGLYATGTLNVTNAGTIDGSTNDGINTYFRSAGSINGIGFAIDNQSGGLIEGAAIGALLLGGGGGLISLINSGTITSTSTNNTGIGLEAGGTISNTTGGIIEGDRAGIDLRSTTTLTNAGLIADTGSTGAGITLSGQSLTVYNLASASITGATNGIIDPSVGHVDNAGLIDASAAGGIGIQLAGGSSITNRPGGVIFGAASGIIFSAAKDTLTNQGTIQGGTMTGDYAVKFAAGGYNRLNAAPGSAFIGAIDGGNTIGATYRSVMYLESGALTGSISAISHFNNIDILPGAKWLIADPLAGLDGIVRGFNQGDTIDLTNITANSETFAGGVLTLSESGSVVGTLDLPGAFTTNQFALSTIGSGTGITLKSAPAPRAVLPGQYSLSVYLSASSYLQPTTLTGSITDPASGYGSALYAASYWHFINQGLIQNKSSLGAGNAVYFVNGGQFNNGPNASVIGGEHGLLIGGAAGMLTNDGLIAGATANVAFSEGVYLSNGSVTNLNAGTITGEFGVYIGYTANIDNSGLIQASGPTNASGIFFGGSGSIQNQKSGKIESTEVGVNGLFAPSLYIGNQGSITATLASGAGDGIEISGTVSNASSGLIAGNNYGVLVDGSNSTIINAGTIAGNIAAVAFYSGAALPGLLVVDPTAIFDGAVAGDFSTLAGGMTTLELAGSVAASLTGIGTSFTGFGVLDFAAGASWTASGDVAGLTGLQTITGFAASDTIVLDGFSETSALYQSGVGLELTGTAASTATLAIDGAFTTHNFKISAQGGNTTISIACFVEDTRILLTHGEIKVQDITPGDIAILADGTTAPVRWIGRRHLDITRHPRPDAISPVLIEAGALADGTPCRDLLVSPDHALLLGGVLIPASILLNGTSIRTAAKSCVTYYHVELDRHGVLLAEGAPAESYLDTGNRTMFENGGAALMLHPDLSQIKRQMESCAPFAVNGDEVQNCRRTLLARATIATCADPRWHIIYGPTGAEIRSRHAIPGLLNPDPADRRRLGIKIASLSANGVAINLDHPALARGWHDLEPDGRWTDGCALVPASVLAGGRLSLQIAATLDYPLPHQPARRTM